jgi:2-keto-4-pentenoate hydratase
LEDHFIDAAARTLWATWQDNKHIDALPTAYRPSTRVDGYRIQAQIAKLSEQKVFGWKIAATSAAGQEHIGVDGPLAGRLLEQRVLSTGARIPLNNNVMKVAEAEFSFRMGRDLPPRKIAYTRDEVFAAVATMHPAIEIPDSRYRHYESAGAAQLIADNACACYFVLGPAVTLRDWRMFDLAQHPVVVYVNGTIARRGVGENVLGDPRIALTWLANELSLVGDMLREGETVTTGTCITPAAVVAGDTVTADFFEFGRVEAELVG